jgi:negative regulator of genetic competence, sporulation and motility
LKNGDFLKIEQLDEKTVRILLSAADMEQLDLTYEEMDYNNTVTKRAVFIILQRIKAQTGLTFDNHRLFIEAFPDSNGGCILYLNLIDDAQRQHGQKERYSFDTPLIFGFESLDSLVAVSKRILNEFNHLVIKTELYLYGNDYRLLLYTYCRMEERIIHLLREYGTFLGKGSVFCAFIKEHAKPILSENAIETVVEYLS